MLKISRTLFISILIFLLPLCNICYAQKIDEINIYENGGTLIELKNKPFLENNTLYIPLREMVNYYGTGQLKYKAPNVIIDHDTKFDGKAHIVFEIGSNKMEVNGTLTEMDAAPIQKSGCVYVPLQYLPWINIERNFIINYEHIGNIINIYLRNDALGKEQINWENKEFNLESLSKHSGNIIELSEENVPINFTWEFSFQNIEEDFTNQNKDTYLTDFIISNNRCKFYKDEDVQAVTIPFNRDYEITFISGNEINDESINRIYRYRDSKLKATSVSIPKFKIQNGNDSYILDEKGFFQQGVVLQESSKEAYLPVNGVADYMFQGPFYFIISDKEVTKVFCKGWVGDIESKKNDPVTKKLEICMKINEDTIQVNGIEKTLRVPAYISRDGYTMLPIRDVTEAFSGTKVVWDNDYKEAEILHGDNYVAISFGTDVMYINGKECVLKKGAEVHDGRMFISLRDICRICNISSEDIIWNNITKTVYISTETHK